MEKDNNSPPYLVGDDTTSVSSVSHSFYSNSLFSMVRGEISDDDLLHSLRIKSLNPEKSSTSTMVMNELMMASYRHKMTQLEDDDIMEDAAAYYTEEDVDITNSSGIAKGSITNHTHTKQTTSQMQRQLLDPPGEREEELQRHTPYVRARYRKRNTDENLTIRALNSAGMGLTKQEYMRRSTEPIFYSNTEQEDHKRKPDPIATESNSNRKPDASSDDDDPLFELARRMSNSCGIEDISSIEGPNDEDYWVRKKSFRAVRSKHKSPPTRRKSRQSRHSDISSDDSSISDQNRPRSRHRAKGYNPVRNGNDAEKQQKSSSSKNSKTKGFFHMFTGKSQDRNEDSSTGGRKGTRNRASSRSTSRSRKSWRSSSGSISSNGSRHSSRHSDKSQYSSSSRRRKNSRNSRTQLTVAEAVAYLNSQERMKKSPSLSSFRSCTSKKSSASKMSSTSRVSRKSTRSSISRQSSRDRKNSTVSKVTKAAKGLKVKIQRCLVSEKTRSVHDTYYSDEDSSCFSASV